MLLCFSFFFLITVHVKEYKSSRYPKLKRNENHIHKLLSGEPFYMKSSRLQQQTNEKKKLILDSPVEHIQNSVQMA